MVMFPAPSGSFPASTGGFPASPSLSDPMFGVNPFAPDTNMYTGELTGLTGLPDIQQRAAQQQHLMQLAQLSSMGLAPETDPHTWTAQEAATQTDNAIAKISTVNPEVAQRLAEQRTPGEDSGGGFFDSLKNLAGEILAPGLELGGRILEAVGRTANIVPNVVFDAVDGGDFDLAGDVGNALAGKDRHNWNSVFQELGWEGDGGLNGFFRATVGLIGDIATDPLTWLIPAGAGTRSAEAAATAARTTGTHAATILERAAALPGWAERGDALVARLTTSYDTILSGARSKLWKVGDDVEERVAGLMALDVSVAERTLMEDMFRIADTSYMGIKNRGFATFARKGSVTLSDGSVVAGKELQAILERAVKAGAFTGPAIGTASSQFKFARQVASSLGGVRLKVAVPFTNLRYISPALPFSKLASEKTIGLVTRAFAGQSGMNRMLSAIGAGHGTMDDLKIWTEQGFDAALEHNPELVNLLRGRFKNLGSMMYSGSEQLGRITAHFGSGAAATRAGLAGYAAHSQELLINSEFNNFVRNVAYKTQLPDGRVLERDQVLKLIEANLGSSLRKKGQTATAEQTQAFAKYLDWFPTGLDTTNPKAIENWFWSTTEYADAAAGHVEAQFAGEGGEAAATRLAAAETKLVDMQATAAGLSGAQRDTLDTMNAIWDHVRNEAAKRDVMLPDVRMNYDSVGMLHPGQVSRWAKGTRAELQQDFFIDVDDAGLAQLTKQKGITDELVLTHDELRGISATRTASGGAGLSHSGVHQAKVRMRGTNWVVLDERAGATMSDEVLLTSAHDGALQAAKDSIEAVDAAAGRPMASRLSEEEVRRNTATMTTDAIRKQRPDSKGVVRIHADGSMEVVVFDPADIKVVSDGAAHLVEQRGYFHRTFTKKMREWIRGKIPREGRQVLISEPEVEAFLSRQTIGMDITEAEAYMKQYLAKEYGIENFPEQVWELDTLKVHEAYVQGTGKAIASEMTGAAAHRMVVLNDLAPTMFGSNPRGQKFEWMLDPGVLRSLASKDTKLVRAVMLANQRGYKLMEEQHARLAADSERYGMFAAMVQESLSAGVEVPDRFVQAVRRYGKTYAGAKSAIDSELVGVREAEDSLRDHLTTYDAALAQVADDPGVGHPGPGAPLSVEDLPDGRQRVRGWHYRGEPGSPDEALAGVAGVEMSNNGFHFGDYDTAMSRANIEMDASSRTIGHRNRPETWPTEEVDVGPRLEPMPGETNEAFMRRALETEPVMETRPVEPDVFYDEVMYPVEAEGSFLGAESGATSGAPLPTEGDLGASFSGSARGETPGKQFDRANLTREGKTGAFYENAVEGAGGSPSVVVLEPSDVHVATGTTAFEQAVADGRVFRYPDGTFGTKRVAGSRRLVSHDSATAQLEKLSTRRNELEGLARSLERGANDVTRFPKDGDILAMTLDDLNRLADNELWDRATKFRPGGVGHLTREEFETLKASIRRRGAAHLEEPLEVFVDPVTGQAIMGEGFHRWMALQELADEGLNIGGVPVKVVYTPGTKGSALYAGARGVPVRRVAEAGSSVASTASATAARLGKVEYAAGRRLKRMETLTNNAMSEANKANAEFHGMVARAQPALVKVETAGNLGGLTRLHVPGLEGYAMPSYIAEEFHHQFDVHGVGALRDGWRQYVMGPWKRWATYRWPGFHVRNFFGAFFNNFLGGVTLKDYEWAWRVTRSDTLKYANRKVTLDEFKRYSLESAFGKELPTYGEVASMLADQGIGRANTSVVMGIGAANELGAEAYRAVGAAAPGRLRTAARKFDTTMRNFGSGIEDFHRAAAWGTGMASTRGDLYGARAFVMMRHGDYADLTGAEDFIRDVVPFYKWMRTNTPYQIRMLAENPAQTTLVADKLKRFATEAQGIDYDQAVLQQPDYMKQTFAIPVPSWVPVIGSKDKDALKFAMFDMPYADLYNGLNDYMSSALPIVRNVLESYGFKQTLFSGKPLTGNYVPLSGVFNIPGVRDILHLAGLTKAGADGTQYMEDRIQNVLMGWPVFSRFRNFTESDPARVDARVGGIFSVLAGVGIKQGDFTQTELDFFYNDVQPLLDQYRSLGIQMPSVDDIQSGEVGAQLGLTSAPETQSAFLAAA